MLKMKINKKLFPVKAHFFFFMAASGPILPYLTVYGKQLGISEVLMGTITAVVPITFLLAKPIFGFVADYFYERRKLVFLSLITSLAVFYIGLYFVPPVNINLQYAKILFNGSQAISCNFLSVFQDNRTDDLKCNVTCHGCTVFGIETREGFCYDYLESDNCSWIEVPKECHDDCLIQSSGGHFLFKSFEFYAFIALMTLSMIFFNVSNSISDAICFDMLGERGENKYGYQRVWGTIGFGITAFLGGFGMDFWSNENSTKNYTPAFLLVVIFTTIDIVFCSRLKLPKMTLSENILKDLSEVLKNKAISVFLVFATLAGILDGFIIYFMFWFLEDLAAGADQIRHVKVLEGLTVAAETLGGEVIFFLLSGKILKKLGYGHTLSLCFFNYALRLGLISLVSNPWWILAVELFMQGPTYALCYTSIVAYANAISPPGTSATMQGVVAGMDDGFGYALGSLIGGFLYKAVGGKLAFQIFAFFALSCCVAHMVLYRVFLSKFYENCSNTNIEEYKPPGESLKMITSTKKNYSENG